MPEALSNLVPSIDDMPPEGVNVNTADLVFASQITLKVHSHIILLNPLLSCWLLQNPKDCLAHNAASYIFLRSA
jgi:hypothetical protein